MKKIFSALTIIVLLAIGCNKADSLCHDCDGMFSDDVTVYINNRYYDCGDGLYKCFQAQVGSSIDETKWQTWTDTICGFNFEPRYRYTLSCRRKKIGKDSNNEPIYKYCLIEIKQKTLMELK